MATTETRRSSRTVKTPPPEQSPSPSPLASPKPSHPSKHSSLPTIALVLAIVAAFAIPAVYLLTSASQPLAPTSILHQSILYDQLSCTSLWSMRDTIKTPVQNELEAWAAKHPGLPEKLMYKAHWSQGAKEYCPSEEEWRIVVEPLRHEEEMKRIGENLERRKIGVIVVENQ